MHIYNRITNIIIKKLKEGVVPWQKPWIANDWPRNLLSKQPYRGINVFILNNTSFNSPYWLTFRQAIKSGGNIKKGERGTSIVYWKLHDVIDEDEEEIHIPLLKYYIVFNLHQCEGICAPEIEKKNNKFETLEQCESIISNMPSKPDIKFGISRAYYDLCDDTINIPQKELFKNSQNFYSTLFHEIIHSTGHPSRLNRKTIKDATYFGSTNYSKEELIAEMGAAFLCAHTGIENKTIDNSAAYITGWLTKLENDNRFVIVAAAKAQKAFEYIINNQK